LDSTAITDDALIHLKQMTQLRHLSLSGTHVNGPGLSHLKDLRLTHLDLSSTGVGDQDVQSVAQMKHLANLDLSHTKIDNAGLAKLSALPELHALKLAGNAVDDDCIESLARFRKLVDLNVSDTGITGNGIAKLVSTKGLMRLYCIDCRGDMRLARTEFQKRQPNGTFVYNREPDTRIRI